MVFGQTVAKKFRESERANLVRGSGDAAPDPNKVVEGQCGETGGRPSFLIFR